MPHLLLVGLGHAHLFVLEALARAGQNRRRTTLVTPGAYHYSGMAPGTIAGDYRPPQSQLRPAYLARAAGADWIDAQVLHIDHHHRRVPLTDYDKRSPFFGKHSFAYDAARDRYICPGGAALPLLTAMNRPRVYAYYRCTPDSHLVIPDKAA